MTLARCVTVPLILWSLMTPLTAAATGAGLQVGTPDPIGPTAIEQALIEHLCTAARATPTHIDAHEECLSAQFLTLRADFGRDLSRLSASDRRTMDSVCNNVRVAHGLDAYLQCLNDQLVSLRSRRNRRNPAPPEATAPSPPSVSAPAASSLLPAREGFSGISGLWIGVALLTVLVAAGAVVLASKARRAQRTCRVCGRNVPESGDLCQECRHEAADAARSAAAERAEQRRAQEEETRRHGEHEAEQRRQKGRQEEEARLRQQEEARRRQEETQQREVDARQRQEEEARQRSQFDVASEETFDPFAVLGLPQDASAENIRTAYQAAKLKYDVDLVTNLSTEVQEHFKAKAEAIDRAYQKLTE